MNDQNWPPNEFVNFPISQGKTTPDKACHSVTFDSGNYVNQYGHSRYLYQLWVVNYVCFSKSCYNKCNQKRHVIETHALNHKPAQALMILFKFKIT